MKLKLTRKIIISLLLGLLLTSIIATIYLYHSRVLEYRDVSKMSIELEIISNTYYLNVYGICLNGYFIVRNIEYNWINDNDILLIVKIGLKTNKEQYGFFKKRLELIKRPKRVLFGNLKKVVWVDS